MQSLTTQDIDNYANENKKCAKYLIFFLLILMGSLGIGFIIGATIEKKNIDDKFNSVQEYIDSQIQTTESLCPWDNFNFIDSNYTNQKGILINCYEIKYYKVYYVKEYNLNIEMSYMSGGLCFNRETDCDYITMTIVKNLKPIYYLPNDVYNIRYNKFVNTSKKEYGGYYALLIIGIILLVTSVIGAFVAFKF